MEKKKSNTKIYGSLTMFSARDRDYQGVHYDVQRITERSKVKPEDGLQRGHRLPESDTDRHRCSYRAIYC